MLAEILRDAIFEMEEFLLDFPKAYKKYTNEINQLKADMESLALLLESVSPNEMIKDCPLCGGQSKFIRNNNMAYVQCQICGCRGPKYPLEELISFSQEKVAFDEGAKNAILSWNQRV